MLVFGGAAITLLQILETGLQVNDLVVQDPFIGIMNQFHLADPLRPGMAVVQVDVLGDYFGHFRITPGFQKGGPDFGMLFLGFQTLGFGDVMEQRPGLQQGQVQGRAGGWQMDRQNPGHPGHLQAVAADIGQHGLLLHQGQALLPGRDAGLNIKRMGGWGYGHRSGSLPFA